jgi:hypothetical protein
MFIIPGEEITATSTVCIYPWSSYSSEDRLSQATGTSTTPNWLKLAVQFSSLYLCSFMKPKNIKGTRAKGFLSLVFFHQKSPPAP